MTKREVNAALDALYAELPGLECRGLCQQSCGPISMSRMEWRRILDRRDVDATQARKLRADLTCPLLAPNGRCRVYATRPMICRLWGVAEDMPCLWGCRPERYLSREEGHEFLRRAQEIGA